MLHLILITGRFMMKYCKNCDLKVKTPLNKCILCDDTLQYYDNKVHQYNYPEYKRKSTFFKTLLKIVITLNLASIFINIYIDYFNNGTNLSWSLIVAISNLYLILIFWLISINKRLFSKILLGILLSSIYVITIGFILSDYIWAINYILPFSIISNIMIITLLLLINRSKWVDYVTTLLLLTILGMSSILLVIFNVTTVYWPTIVLASYALSTFLGLFILSP